MVELGKFKDTKGHEFGEWTVLEYVGNSKWRCKCSCGTVNDVIGADLRSGRSVKCKRHPKRNLTGTTLHCWNIKEYNRDGTYTCKCNNCGNVEIISQDRLQSKRQYTKLCSCNSKRDKLDDLTGKQFGFLVVREGLQVILTLG